ncbi:MAG: hypothetical protein FWB77_00695 [Treponema sp.]|nr:hypothetical protein [Treponema sp.]
MNKKGIFVLGIAMILMAMVSGMAFAEEDTEYEYTITVQYRNSRTNQTGSKTYTLWAASAAEAAEQAKQLCEWDFGTNSAISCGIPRVTGRKR